MDKLRRRLIQARVSIPEEKRIEYEQQIADRLLPLLVPDSRIGIYAAAQGEPDLLRFLQNGQFELFAPAVLNQTDMEFRRFEHLQPGWMNILEPQAQAVDPMELDIILVPVVGFSHLFRIGHGNGYYDRYLVQTKAKKIGIAFDEQECTFKPYPWDVPMDFVVTPGKILGMEDTTCQ